MATPVHVRPSLLRERVERLSLPAGLTVAEILAVALPDEHARRCAYVEIGGQAVPPAMWERVRPIKGTEVAIAVVPAGGQDVMRLVLTVAVVALAAYAGPVAAGAILGAGASAGALAATGAAITASIAIAGTLALNALIPPVQPQLSGSSDRSSPTYFLDASRNAARPWGPVPIVLGQHRRYPELGAEIKTEALGDSSYLTAALVWSQGPVELTDLRIGETALSNYSGVQIEHDEADPDAAPSFALYPDDVHQEQVGAVLSYAAGYVSRTTQDDTEEVTVEIWFPRGLFGVGKKTGDQFGQSVAFQIQTSPVGTGIWTTQLTPTASGKSKAAIRRAYTISGLTAGQYAVRVKRTTADSTSDYYINDSTWGVLRSVRRRAPILAKYLTATCYRILATNQLSGVVDTFNGIATSKCLDWDSGTETWIERTTRNPASLFRHILQFPTQKITYADDEIDLETLQDWHEYCDSSAFTCDLVVDWNATTDEVLRIVAACGRAMPVWRDGQRSVIIDRAQTTYVQRFTPRNSRSFSCTRIYSAEIHGFRIRYINSNVGYLPDERYVYADGYDSNNATIFEELEAPGITSPELAWRYGRWMLAQAKLRPEIYTLETDWEHLIATRGDLVEIQSDALLIGAGQGRIKSIATGGGAITTITLDDTLTMDPDIRYGAVAHNEAGDRITFPLAYTAGTTRVLTPDSVLPDDTALEVGNLVMLGELGRETLDAVIKSVEPMPDLAARLTLVPAAWVNETAAIPDFDTRITTPPALQVPIILAVRSDEASAQRDADGSIHLRAVVSLYSDGSRSAATIAGVEVRYRPADSEGEWAYVSGPAEATVLYLDVVEDGVTYEIAARYRLTAGGTGGAGPWSATLTHEVVGPDLPPPDVETLFVDGDRVAWLYDTTADPSFSGYRVRHAPIAGAAWEVAEDLTDALLVVAEVPLAQLPLDARVILVKAETTSGVQSATAGRLTITPSATAARYTVHAHDFAAEGFQGTLTGCEVIADVLTAEDTSVFLDPAGGLFLTPSGGTFLATSYAELRWTASYTIPVDVIASDRIRLTRTASDGVSVYYRWANDALDTLEGSDEIPDEFLEGEAGQPLGTVFDATGRPWLPWRDGLRPVAGELLQLLVIAPAGNTPATVSAFTLIIDGAAIVEPIGSCSLDDEGSKLSVANTYRRIVWVSALLEAPTAATTISIVLLEADGPTLIAHNATGSPVAAVANVTVGGY
jgi:hypothetical protein